MIDREALLALLDSADAHGWTRDELADRILALDPKARQARRVVLLELSAYDLSRLPALFAEKTREEGECLVWTGPRNHRGYGVVATRDDARSARRSTNAHRAAWMLANGSISSADLVVDHLCRNRACVRGDHLELVTARENVQRGDVPKTRCKQGHPLSGDNLLLYRHPKTGYLSRLCRECRREYHRKRRLAH